MANATKTLAHHTNGMALGLPLSLKPEFELRGLIVNSIIIKKLFFSKKFLTRSVLVWRPRGRGMRVGGWTMGRVGGALMEDEWNDPLCHEVCHVTVCVTVQWHTYPSWRP